MLLCMCASGHVSKQHPLHHLLNSSRAAEVNVSTDSRFSISPSSSPGGQRESEAGDDLDAALADLDQELEQLGSPSRPAGSHGSSPPQGPSQGRQGDSGSRPALLGPAEEREGLARKSRFAQAAESQVLELEVAAEVDLNKVTEVELALAKKRMEQDFNKNRLKPGDPGFEYDKQVDFGPATEDNDWDD
ncbi:CEP19-like protein-domain-containing protein [Haematococcus lacustris]